GSRAVVAAVIDREHLSERFGGGLCEGLLDQAPEIALLVKRRNYKGKTHYSSLIGRGKWALTTPSLTRFSHNKQHCTQLRFPLPPRLVHAASGTARVHHRE